MPEWQRALLCDPQTSGGLLIAAAPEVAEAVRGAGAGAGLRAGRRGRAHGGGGGGHRRRGVNPARHGGV